MFLVRDGHKVTPELMEVCCDGELGMRAEINSCPRENIIVRFIPLCVDTEKSDAPFYSVVLKLEAEYQRLLPAVNAAWRN